MKRCHFPRSKNDGLSNFLSPARPAVRDAGVVLYDIASDHMAQGDYGSAMLIAPRLCRLFPYGRKTWLFLAKPLGHFGLFQAARRAHVLSLQIRPNEMILLEAFVQFFDVIAGSQIGDFAQHAHYVRTWFQYRVDKQQQDQSLRTNGHANSPGYEKSDQMDIPHLERLAAESFRAKHWLQTFKAAIMILKLQGPSVEYWSLCVDCLQKMDQVEWAFYAERQMYNVFEFGVPPVVAKHFLDKYGASLRLSSQGFTDGNQLPPLELVRQDLAAADADEWDSSFAPHADNMHE
ncbi:putative mitochondrial protein [Andalucia godoyi]|uniref:Putative mitochondrial protein n=1 Tax=Andalucia godoyi TaxID=505711 RepID=A0A8K0F4F4_ANDGO|nr:putative mitochondrial protein [Andalucia godoyi]|eukprot:ANDGO_06931.mRNA.1 putative mitochondrial protein